MAHTEGGAHRRWNLFLEVIHTSKHSTGRDAEENQKIWQFLHILRQIVEDHHKHSNIIASRSLPSPVLLATIRRLPALVSPTSMWRKLSVQSVTSQLSRGWTPSHHHILRSVSHVFGPSHGRLANSSFSEIVSQSLKAWPGIIPSEKASHRHGEHLKLASHYKLEQNWEDRWTSGTKTTMSYTSNSLQMLLPSNSIRSSFIRNSDEKGF